MVRQVEVSGRSYQEALSRLIQAIEPYDWPTDSDRVVLNVVIGEIFDPQRAVLATAYVDDGCGDVAEVLRPCG